MGIDIGPAYDVEAEARGSTKGSVVKSCKTESTPRYGRGRSSCRLARQEYIEIKNMRALVSAGG